MESIEQIAWRVIGIFAQLAPVLGAGIAIALLRFFFPAKKDGKTPAVETEPISKEQLRLHRFFMLGMLLLVLPCGYLAFHFLVQLGHFRAGFLPPAVFLMVPDEIVWFIPALFSGLILGGLSAEGILYLKSRDLHRQYKETAERIVQVKMSPRAEKIFLASISVLIVGFVALALDNYVLIHTDRVVANGFFSFKEDGFRFAEVRDIRVGYKVHNKIGGITNLPKGRYIFTLKSGNIWSDDYYPEEISEERRREIAEHIANAAGVEIREVEFIDHEEF